MSVRLEDLGEFGLIARLTRGLETRPDVVLGVGDDAAVLAPGSGMLLVATCDAQVEGRHFTLATATPHEIGHKALAVNLSDIAAMGAEPFWVLVSLVLPQSLDLAVLDGIYAGLRDLARPYHVAVVGGNVSGTDGPLVLDITLLGQVARGAYLTRAGGRPGDLLVVTGSLGAAAAGVLARTHLPAGAGIGLESLARVHEAMVAPAPRVAEGQALAASGVVTAMLDISDGFAADLGHLCEASHVGAEVEADLVPVDAAAAEIARAYGRDPLALALIGGEDYELLCAVRPDASRQALDAVARTGTAARVIGRLTEREGIFLRRSDGSARPLERRGWDHLRTAPTY